MTTMTATYHPLPSLGEAQAQLIADLRAVLSLAPSADAQILVGRPSILRRLAGNIAASIGPEIDRIMSRTGPDAQLATAVCVHTGVAMTVVTADGSVSGEIRPGERIVTVPVFGSDADAQSLDRSLPLTRPHGSTTCMRSASWPPAGYGPGTHRPSRKARGRTWRRNRCAGRRRCLTGDPAAEHPATVDVCNPGQWLHLPCHAERGEP